MVSGFAVWQNGDIFIHFDGSDWLVSDDTSNAMHWIKADPDLNSRCPYKSDGSRIRDLKIQKYLQAHRMIHHEKFLNFLFYAGISRWDQIIGLE